MTEDSVPAGFAALRPRKGFLEHFGQLYVDRDRRVVAVRVAQGHLNPLGIAHGGMLATLADSAIGIVMALDSGSARPPAVTVNLSLDFFEGARAGDWLEAHVEFERIGKRLRFGSCRLMVGERCLLRATAIFSAVTPRA